MRRKMLYEGKAKQMYATESADELIQLFKDDATAFDGVKHEVEVVIRNVAAGSICKRLGLEEGMALERPLTELFYKSDELHDPLINEEHALLFGWANHEDLQGMRAVALEVNRVLSELMAMHGILLVDFKLEFGRDEGGQIRLGDEITPDGCRLWDVRTGKKLDKDVFRRDLGGLSKTYHEVASRLSIPVEFTAPE